MDPFTFAFNELRRSVNDRSLLSIETRAILTLRALVEEHKVAVEMAIKAITAVYPLGLNQLGKIADKAREKYNEH